MFQNNKYLLRTWKSLMHWILSENMVFYIMVLLDDNIMYSMILYKYYLQLGIVLDYMSLKYFNEPKNV